MELVRLSSVGNALPVEVEDVRADLRIDSTDEDATLRRMIQAAASFLEARTGYVLMPGDYTAFVDAWPTDPIEIMRGPLRSLDAVEYLEAHDTWTPVDLSNFHVSRRKRSFLLSPHSTFTAPTLFTCRDSVRLTFSAGFAATEDGTESEGESAGDRPIELDPALRTLLIMLVGHWYKNRELFAADESAKIAAGAVGLLASYRQLW